MEKQPTGSSSLLQTEQQHSHSPLPRHPGFFPSCSGRLLLGLATLEPSLFGLRLGLGHGLLGLALALVGVALALHGSWLGLGSWLLGCSLGFGLLELVLEPVLMEHAPTLAQGIPPCPQALWVLAVEKDIPQQQRLDLVLIWLGDSHGCTGSWLPHGHGCWY